jgi:hypothetical protein
LRIFKLFQRRLQIAFAALPARIVAPASIRRAASAHGLNPAAHPVGLTDPLAEHRITDSGRTQRRH